MLKYRFEKLSIDTYNLIYINKDNQEEKLEFKRTIDMASKLQGVTARARIKMFKELTEQGLTKDDLIIKKKMGNGKTIYDETNYIEFEKKYMEEEQVIVINEIIESSFGMNMIELFNKLGIDLQSHDEELGKEMQLFGQKLVTVLSKGDDEENKIPSDNDSKEENK